MISYDNKQNYFRLICRLKGSVFPRSSAYAFVSAAIALALLLHFRSQGYEDADLESLIQHPFAVQIYAICLGFVIVFRTTIALGRYWEGMTHFETMASKWVDAYMQICAFVNASLKCWAVGTLQHEELLEMKSRLLHWFTLLCSTAVDVMQGEEANDICIEDWRVVPLKQAREVASRPLHSSSESSSSLLGSSDEKHPGKFGNEDIVILGAISPEEMELLHRSSDKVLLIVEWIVEEISMQIVKGRMKIPPPILSRVYQELSNGMLGFNQGMKIAAIPFPFPFAQMLSLLLCSFIMICPLMVVVFTRSSQVYPWAVSACILDFFAILGYIGLNEIAIELENPFGDDVNDLPLLDAHRDMIISLHEIYLTVRPYDDHLDDTPPTTPRGGTASAPPASTGDAEALSTLKCIKSPARDPPAPNGAADDA